MNNLRKEISSSVGEFQNQGRKQQKIDDSTAKKGGDDIQPDLPIPGGNDKEKQAGSDQKPEQQVQHRDQQSEPHPNPQDPAQVVN